MRTGDYVLEKDPGAKGRSGLTAMFNIINREAVAPDKINRYRDEFLRRGYTVIRDFLSTEAISLLSREIDELMSGARKRDFSMPGYETPRKLTVIGGQRIMDESRDLLNLYHRHDLRSVIDEVAGQRAYTCTHPEEFMVSNLLNSRADTHGWHLDDPAYAFVICIRSQGQDAGGEIELIPHWTDMCESLGHSRDMKVSELIPWFESNGLLKSELLDKGDAYLLRADRTLHRVSPLKRDGVERLVVNLAYQDRHEVAYGDTAALLYSEQ